MPSKNLSAAHIIIFILFEGLWDWGYNGTYMLLETSSGRGLYKQSGVVIKEE
jgi:hypothetical protein